MGGANRGGTRIAPETLSLVLRSLKVESRDFMDIALPSANSLFSAIAMGANSACGLGDPESLALAKAVMAEALPLFSNLAGPCRYDQDTMDLSEETCPFCFNAVANPIWNKWAVFAFWKEFSKEKQDHILSLCASNSSNVASLAVCKDRNWISETAGQLSTAQAQVQGDFDNNK